MSAGNSKGRHSLPFSVDSYGSEETNHHKLCKNEGFLALFEKQKWRTIRKRLKSKIANRLVQSKGTYRISSLGLALGHNAPIDIVILIMDLDASIALQKDGLGASPLHIACLNGAPFETTRILIERYPHLVADRDADFRTPLHHAVECMCQLERGNVRTHENVLKIIGALVDVAPQTVHYTDKHGDSPLDLTHIVMMENDTSSFSSDESIYNRVESLYRYLKKVSIKVYLQQKEKWEIAGFDLKRTIMESSNKSNGSQEDTEDSTVTSHE